MTATVTCEVDGAVATVHFDNPVQRNAVSYAFFLELADILERLAGSDEVAVVVLTGRGGNFCVGADLAAPPETRTLRGRPDDAERLHRVSRVASLLHRMPQATIAAIDGACAGGGLALAAAADLRVATDRAIFNTAFLAVGLSGDIGAVWFVHHLLGAARTRELFLLPGKLPAAEAQRIGLVHRVVGPDALDAETAALATRLAGVAPRALRALKANLVQASSDDLEPYLRDETERMVASFASPDAAEAATAYLDKRDPAFRRS